MSLQPFTYQPSYGLPPPGSCELTTCTIAGTQLKAHVREIKIYESILRPYILVELTMYDHHNWGNTLKLEGGEPVALVITNAFGTRYDWKGVVAKQKGEFAATGGRTVGTVISATDPAFIENPSAKVVGSWQNVPGTNVINEIHDQYLNSTGIYRMSPSLGMIGEKEPFIISNDRPWDAIAKIRRQITSMAFPDSGAYAYYRDNKGFALMPLEQLFAEMSSGAMTFIQDATVGKSFLDMHKLHTQILAFKSSTSVGGGNINKASRNRPASPIVNVWDVMGNTFNKLTEGKSQSHYIPHDRQLNKIAPKQLKAGGENKMGEMTQDGPGYAMQILFDLGCKLTVGRGVIAKPVVPQGDLTTPNYSGARRAGGLGLIINLTHHIKNYDTKPQAITTLECSQGGIPE